MLKKVLTAIVVSALAPFFAISYSAPYFAIVHAMLDQFPPLPPELLELQDQLSPFAVCPLPEPK